MFGSSDSDTSSELELAIDDDFREGDEDRNDEEIDIVEELIKLDWEEDFITDRELDGADENWRREEEIFDEKMEDESSQRQSSAGMKLTEAIKLISVKMKSLIYLWIKMTEIWNLL